MIEDQAQAMTWFSAWRSVRACSRHMSLLMSLTLFFLLAVRNVYTLFDYGDFVENSTDVAQSYIKLLSTTNRTEGEKE